MSKRGYYFNTGIERVLSGLENSNADKADYVEREYRCNECDEYFEAEQTDFTDALEYCDCPFCGGEGVSTT